MNKYEERICCASCKNNNLTDIIDLGKVPLAGCFPKDENIVDIFPLTLQFCENCKLVQTDSVIDPDTLFRDYRYLSSIGLSKHFENFTNDINSIYGLNNKKVLEFGCNDGVLLEPLTKVGADALGVDPSINVTKIAKDKGLNVITDYFNYENFGKTEWESKFDFIFGNNAFAHIIDINSTARAVEHCLKDDGIFIFEVHYLANLIDENQWDNIYHEHIYYYSITSLNNMLLDLGMTIIDYDKIPIHSGSIRVTAKKGHHIQNEKIKQIIDFEKNTICNIEYLYEFNKRVKKHIIDFKNIITDLKSKNIVIAGYGASGRANMFCNITEIDKDTIKFIVDESPERCNRYIPNMNIPIVDANNLIENKIDVLIIFAWNYSKMIIEKTKSMNFKYMLAFPEIKFIESNDVKNLNTL
jgi:SAM-dependent methyltransferase